MKIRTACIVLGVSLFIAAAAISYGQDYMDRSLGDAGDVSRWKEMKVGEQLIGVPGRIGIGARIGQYCPADSNKIDTDIAFEGQVSYAANSNLLVVLEGGYTNPDLKIGPEDAEAELTYVNLTLELRGEPEPNFGIYLGFGPTLFFQKFKNMDEAGTDCRNTICGGNVSFGIDYFVTQFLAINIDCKYIASFKDVKCDIDGAEEKLPELDGLIYGAGLKYFF